MTGKQKGCNNISVGVRNYLFTMSVVAFYTLFFFFIVLYKFIKYPYKKIKKIQ